MIQIRVASLCRAILLVAALVAPGQVTAAGDFNAGLALGYKTGITFRGSAGVMGFAKGFPLGLEFGVEYSVCDPGNAAKARKIFVNDATNGTPEKNGHTWDLRLDFVYDLHLLQEGSVYAYGGARYSMYAGEFIFVGGNEDFEVTSGQWGLGAGVKGSFSMSPHVDFVMSAGLDYFLPAPLSGHDTTYDPNGDNVNGRTGYAYKDADAAIYQPGFQPVVMLGVKYNF
jgi:hypothetical protein